MCSQVSTLPTDPTELANLIAKCQKTIRSAEEFVDECYKFVEKYQDDYRTFGVAYHATQLDTRCMHSFGPDTDHLLKEAFEITTEDHYHKFITPITKFSLELDKAREIIQSNGPPEELVRRAESVQDIEDNITRCLTTDDSFGLEKVRRALIEVRAGNRRILEDTDSCPRAKSNALVDLVTRFPVCGSVFKDCEQWDLYRAWVGSLPKARGAVRLDRSMDIVAVDMLSKLEQAKIIIPTTVPQGFFP